MYDNDNSGRVEFILSNFSEIGLDLDWVVLVEASYRRKPTLEVTALTPSTKGTTENTIEKSSDIFWYYSEGEEINSCMHFGFRYNSWPQPHPFIDVIGHWPSAELGSRGSGSNGRVFFETVNHGTEVPNGGDITYAKIYVPTFSQVE